MSKPDPVLPVHVYEGGHYWAGMGETRWGAVTIIKKKRKSAEVDRVNARTNETTKRGAKVKVDRLVKRDPKQKGKDKPTCPPSEVFVNVAKPEPEPEPEVEAEQPVIVKRGKADLKKVKAHFVRYKMNTGATREEAEAEWDTPNDW